VGSQRWVSAIALAAAVVASTAFVAVHDLGSRRSRDARTELQSVLSRMQRLRTLRVSETLQTRPGGPTLRTEYRFEAPDRFAYDQSGISDASSITIGTNQFLRGGPSEQWRANAWPSPTGFKWPGDFYDTFWTPAAAIHSLGAVRWHGLATHLIAFSRADTNARFRLWIGDSDGLVHGMEMRAPGHIMNQTYYDFDRTLRIAAPTG
jgi:hypothetical protein